MGRVGQYGGRALGRLALAAMAALMAQGAQAAPAAGAADYPATTAEADILRWIAARTSISRGSILILEPKAVVALAAKGAPMGSVVRGELREELISPDVKARSALFIVDLDCSTRRYRIVERRIFPLPDLKGEPQVDPQARAWAPVIDTAPVGRAWLAACTDGFVFPYAAQVAAAPPAQPTPPAPPPPPRRLAAAKTAPAAPPPSPSPAPDGAYEAVLGAYTVRANAEAASEKLGRALAGRLQGRRKTLVPATVKGTNYTVLTVSGFATAGEASGFCAAAKAIPLACIVKRGSD